jgi:hypothetical protein
MAQKTKQISNPCYIGATYTWHLSQPNRDKTHFVVARILTTFQRCHLQTKNMENLIFVHNWPCDSWIGCLKPIDVAFACEGEFDLMAKL